MARQLRDAQCHTIWEGTENICAVDVRRAMRSEGAHRAVIAHIARSLDRAGSHKVLERAADGVAAALSELQEAVRWIERAPEDMALLNIRRLAELMADTLEGALLIDEAAWSLERDGDARKAAVARRFAARRLQQLPMRGIGDPDRSVIDLFEPIVRYGQLGEDEVLAAAG